MQDWCAKLPGQMLRIAGILALCDEKHQIDVDVVNRASIIAAWFVENAAVVFGEQEFMTEDFSESNVMQFLDERTISQKGESVKTSELFAHYKEWVQEYGYEALSAKDFVGELRKSLVVSRSAKGNVAKDVFLK